MDDSASNPYQAVLPAPVEWPLEPLRFRGVIQPMDYQQMLPKADREWWLCLVLAILVSINILAFGPIIVFVAFAERGLLEVLGLVAYMSLIIASFWFLKSRIRSSDRATRYLKMYPDVLGTAEGEFTVNGLLFHDGENTYWFGARHLLRTSIRRDGMRVHVDATTHHYLALSSRLFDIQIGP